MAKHEKDLKAKPKEIVREIEVIREVPVEIVKEVEVIKYPDMDELIGLLKNLGTKEVSRQVVGQSISRGKAKIVKSGGTVKKSKASTAKRKTVVITKLTSKAKTGKVGKDKLKKIEGIGPKIEQLLHAAKILTFDQLAKSKVDKLRAILSKAGPRFQVCDPGTLARQSKLAAAGK